MQFPKKLRRCALLCAATCTAQQKPSSPLYIAVVKGQDIHVTGSMLMVTGGIAAASGAHVEAEKHNAILSLTRGGEAALCQGSSLSLEARGSQLWLALQSGTLEARYPLSAGADTLLTPDYRLSLISASGMPGQVADYRIGVGQHGDLLVQVGADSEAYITVSSNFETMQAVVRPGEVRGFPAFGSKATAAEVVAEVPLRCPVEKAESPTLSATVEHEPVPAGTLNIPLAYRAPELPSITPTPPPEKAAAPAEKATLPPPESPPSPPVQEPASVTQPSPLQAPPVKKGNVFRRFFHRLFGPQNSPK